jgi:hypothetical protein
VPSGAPQGALAPTARWAVPAIRAPRTVAPWCR